jgi:hypothetical protein
MGNDWKQDLKIDQYALDKAALSQPELFAEWAMEWANAVRERDRLKDKLALVRSTVDQYIRETPGDFGWDKEKAPTEAFINSAITTSQYFVDANDAYLDSQHDVNVMGIAKEAFEHRRRMIDNLIQLYMSGYFSGNKKLDAGYQEVLAPAAATAQAEGLAASPRLARRTPAVPL